MQGQTRHSKSPEVLHRRIAGRGGWSPSGESTPELRREQQVANLLQVGKGASGNGKVLLVGLGEVSQ
eukprot:5897308-Prorocentrum_lima.AAC.1